MEMQQEHDTLKKKCAFAKFQTVLNENASKMAKESI